MELIFNPLERRGSAASMHQALKSRDALIFFGLMASKDALRFSFDPIAVSFLINTKSRRQQRFMNGCKCPLVRCSTHFALIKVAQAQTKTIKLNEQVCGSLAPIKSPTLPDDL
jgi:hypothetical protein